MVGNMSSDVMVGHCGKRESWEWRGNGGRRWVMAGVVGIDEQRRESWGTVGEYIFEDGG